MYVLKQSSTSRVLMFLMVDSTDHVTGKTGLTPTVTISKNGAAFAAPSGAVSEVGSGWYKVAGNATDTNTLGPLALHATAAGADPTDTMYEVSIYDPHDLINTIADAVIDEVYEGSETVRQALRLFRAVLLGASTGQPSAPVFKSANGSTNRVTASVSAAGNRSSVVTDAS